MSAHHCTGSTQSSLISLSASFDSSTTVRQFRFENDSAIKFPGGWHDPQPAPTNECDIAWVEWADACHLEHWIHHDDTVGTSWSQQWAGPWWTCEGSGDPIVFDLGNNGFMFTDPNTEPVEFDIDNDGELETLAWITQGSDDAFLVLDKNGNNIVDSGAELFGNGTMLLSGELAQVGFLVLEELDRPEWGGNSDGLITKDDQQFQKLRLWTDTNQNAISEPSEMRTLMSQGIQSVDLTYFGSNDEDDFGNGLYFQGSAEQKIQGQIRTINIVDVFFQLAD